MNSRFELDTDIMFCILLLFECIANFYDFHNYKVVKFKVSAILLFLLFLISFFLKNELFVGISLIITGISGFLRVRHYRKTDDDWNFHTWWTIIVAGYVYASALIGGGSISISYYFLP